MREDERPLTVGRRRWLALGLLGVALATLSLLASMVVPVVAAQADPLAPQPEVKIEPAEQTPTGFRLKAKVNPEGSPTTYYFIYKDTGVECEDLEGCGPETPRGGPLTGDTQQEVSAEVTGLDPGRQYRYWLIARNGAPAAVRSNELWFTTPPAGTAPVIDSVSITHLTPTDATLEAQIDTEGLETTYEFKMWASPCSHHGGGCELIEIVPLPSGKLLGSFVDQNVSLDLNSAGVKLTPGGEYAFSVSATNADGSVEENPWHHFEPPYSPPAIDIESVSNITAHDATLEARVNLHEAPAGVYYQFQIVKDSSEYASEFTCPTEGFPAHSSLCLGIQPQAGALPIGFIPGNTLQPGVDRSVSLDLVSAGVTLAAGTTYHYRVLVARRVPSEDTIQWEDPTVYAPDQTFTTPSPGVSPQGDEPSTASGNDQPGIASTQADSEGSLSSSTQGVKSPGPLKLKPLTNAQKLAKALKLCERKPRRQRAACEKQAHKRYGPSRKKPAGR